MNALEKILKPVKPTVIKAVLLLTSVVGLFAATERAHGCVLKCHRAHLTRDIGSGFVKLSQASGEELGQKRESRCVANNHTLHKFLQPFFCLEGMNVFAVITGELCTKKPSATVHLTQLCCVPES